MLLQVFFLDFVFPNMLFLLRFAALLFIIGIYLGSVRLNLAFNRFNMENQLVFLCLKSLHVEKWEADGIAHKLPKTGSWHFMMGGTEGAIVSEFANFHDSKCNRFSVPGVIF